MSGRLVMQHPEMFRTIAVSSSSLNLVVFIVKSVKACWNFLRHWRGLEVKYGKELCVDDLQFPREMFCIKIFNRAVTSILIQKAYMCCRTPDGKTEKKFLLVSDISAEKVSYPFQLVPAAPPVSFHKIPGPYLRELYQLEINCAEGKPIRKKGSASCFEHL